MHGIWNETKLPLPSARTELIIKVYFHAREGG